MTPRQSARQAALHWEVSNRTALNRAVAAHGCVYSHHSHGGCAVGRLCTSTEAESLPQLQPVFSVFKLLPAHVRSLGLVFLSRLQELHDNSYNWTDSGLSAHGRARAADITTEFNLATPRHKQISK